MKSIMLFIVLYAGISLQCHSQTLATQRQYLKQYTFCSCFQQASGDSLYFRNIDISLGELRDLASYHDTVFKVLDNFAKAKARTIVPSNYADHEGQKAVMLGCLQLFESKALDSLVHLQDKYIINGWDTGSSKK